jgi:Enoyl-CoA hydratase/isomerase
VTRKSDDRLSAESSLRIAHDAGRLTLTLDRPHRRNALDAVLVEALHGALDNIDQTEITMLVIEGAGPSFCSGFDLGDLDAETDGSLLLRFVRIEQLLQRLFRAPYTTVALAQGHAFGAGADLFCACQHRFAAHDTTFRSPARVSAWRWAPAGWPRGSGLMPPWRCCVQRDRSRLPRQRRAALPAKLSRPRNAPLASTGLGETRYGSPRRRCT